MTLRASFGKHDKVHKLMLEGRLKEALHLLESKVYHASEAPQSSIASLLRECTRRKSLAEGKQVHALIVKTKCDNNILLSNLLIGMYSACGHVAEALKVFTSIPQQNLFSWTSMISAYAKGGRYEDALTLFQQMHQIGIEPNEVACIIALKACAKVAALKQGQHLHSLILKKGFDSNLIVQTTLVDMYSKCRCLKEARELFDNMTRRDRVSWNAMIAGYSQEGLGQEALELSKQMKHEGMEPNNVTLVLLLKACANISALEQGKQLHSLVLEQGLESELIVQTAVIDMYSKCGCLKDAHELFDNMTVRNVVSWNVIIAGYAHEGFGKEALDLYEQMNREGVESDNITVALILKVCAGISALQQGKHLHSLILEKGLESELIVQNALVDMYSKCRCLKDARELFDKMIERDLISWTAMIAGYAQEGLGREALDLYEKMKCEDMKPDNITIALLLKACAKISALQQGKQLHSLVLEQGLECKLIVQNGLIDMYSKCGCVKEARELFDKMKERDVISWNAMMAGYAQEGLGKEALDFFQQMKDEGVQANELTYTSVLAACSHSGLVDEARHVFENMSIDGDVTATLEQYACIH